MNATVVQDAIPATEEPNAIPETADHQQLTEQQVRRMVYIHCVVIFSLKNVNRRAINNGDSDDL